MEKTEYITREEAKMSHCNACSWYGTCTDETMCEDVKAILAVPAADVKSVVHGEWIFEEYELASWCTKAICSSCKKIVANNSDLAHDWGQKLFLHDYQFCPKCGASMKKEKKYGDCY